MAKDGDAKIAGRVGPLRSPQAEYLVNKGPLSPPVGANTTIPGTAPNAAPIRSPLPGYKQAKQ
jgi:hypothetical protein